MGNIESADVRKVFGTEVHSFLRPTPRFHQINGVQHGLAMAFFTTLTSACLKCGSILVEEQDYPFRKARMGLALPRDQSLVFNKNEVMKQWQQDAIYGLYLAQPLNLDAFNYWKSLRTDVSEIPEVYRSLYGEGYPKIPNIISNRWIMFFGRETAVLEECIEEILPDSEKGDECQEALRLSTQALIALGKSFTSKLKEDPTTVWVLPPGPSDEWKARPVFRDLTYEGDEIHD